MSSRFNASEWALTHKSFVLMLMILFILAGLSAYRSLGRDEDPPFTIKTMLVKAYWPGADAESTASQLTDRLEKAVEPLQWLDQITSSTSAGETTLFINLLDQTPPSAVPDQWYQVRKRIGDIVRTLPEGTAGPFFNDDFGDVYGVIYALTSDGFSYRELRDRGMKTHRCGHGGLDPARPERGGRFRHRRDTQRAHRRSREWRARFAGGAEEHDPACGRPAASSRRHRDRHSGL